MRLGIVSDIHGNLVALEAVIASLRSKGVDAVVNLGDCVTSPLWPRETWELLETLRWPTVRGNHDRWLTDPPSKPIFGQRSVDFCRAALSGAAQQALAALPAKLEVDGGILAVHGRPDSDSEYLLEDAVDDRLANVTQRELARRVGATNASLVLCGHSHQQHAAFASRTCLVLNPGSVGCPRTADSPSIERNEAGGPLARYAIATRAGDGWDLEMIGLTYDASRVVERAIANGRPDWAEGFVGVS